MPDNILEALRCAPALEEICMPSLTAQYFLYPQHPQPLGALLVMAENPNVRAIRTPTGDATKWAEAVQHAKDTYYTSGTQRIAIERLQRLI